MRRAPTAMTVGNAKFNSWNMHSVKRNMMSKTVSYVKVCSVSNREWARDVYEWVLARQTTRTFLKKNGFFTLPTSVQSGISILTAEFGSSQMTN